MNSAWLKRVTALAIVAFAGGAGEALAQEEPAPLRARLGSNANMVTVSFDITSAFTEHFRKKLGSGFTSTVFVQMQLVDSKNKEVDLTVRECKLRLELWDEKLFLNVTDEHQVLKKGYKVVDEALKVCGVVDNVPIADRSLLTAAGGYRLVVRVALNPVNPEVLERAREDLANPRGAAGGGRPRAFFGAVAKLFRSDSTAGGERFIFQSQPLSRP